MKNSICAMIEGDEIIIAATREEFRVHRLGLFASCVSFRYRASDTSKSLPFHAEHGQRLAAFTTARASSSRREIFDRCTRQGLTNRSSQPLAALMLRFTL